MLKKNDDVRSAYNLNEWMLNCLGENNWNVESSLAQWQCPTEIMIDNDEIYTTFCDK